MKLTNRQGNFLKKVIAKWQAEGTLNEQEAQKLYDSYTIQSFDWKKLARYSFWIAIICGLISFGAVIDDAYILHLIEDIFEQSNAALCLALGLLSAGFYFLGLRGRKKNPENEFSNEAIIFAGALFTAGAIAYLGRAINIEDHFSVLFMLAAVVYVVLGIWFPSGMVWVLGLLAMGAGYGTEMGYQSGWKEYYMGMSYPFTFVFFGAGIVALALVFKYWRRFAWLYKPTMRVGLLYLFISLWILSVFGNCADLDRWYSVKSSQLIGWDLVFAGVALLAITFGVKTEDAIARGFGITFLLINIYTRYFEHFWNSMHKAVFFFILALSFWVVGRWAEKIWNVGSGIQTGEPSIPEEALEEE